MKREMSRTTPIHGGQSSRGVYAANFKVRYIRLFALLLVVLIPITYLFFFLPLKVQAKRRGIKALRTASRGDELSA